MGNEVRRPARMSFTNLENGRSLEAQFNPEKLKEKLSVDWAELEVQGMSHRPHQYSGTANHTFTFTLQFNCVDNGGGDMVTSGDVAAATPASGTTQNRQAAILKARQYLLSMAYGPRGRQDIVGSSPSRFLFVWPNMVALTCVLHEIEIEHLQFDLVGRSMRFDADLTIKEIRDVRLYGEDVFSDGTFRNTAEDS
jgi:contractile injection system tube protein